MKLILIALATLSMAACTTGEKVRGTIAPGMSQQELTAEMGKPDSFRARGEYTIYEYTNRLISGWSWDRTDYTFIFKDGELVEYGSGEVRERDVGGVHHIFIHNN